MSVHDAGGHPLMSLTRAYSLFSYVAPVAVRLAPCRDATNRPFEHSPPYSVVDTAGPCGSPRYRLPGPYPPPTTAKTTTRPSALIRCFTKGAHATA